MTIHFKQADFDQTTWSWLNQKGDYNAETLHQIFDQRTPAHFQYGFDVYHEVNKAIGTDPTYRASQLLFKASSATINTQAYTSLLNQFMTLKIEVDDDNDVN
jgi:hypothetical protein